MLSMFQNFWGKGDDKELKEKSPSRRVPKQNRNSRRRGKKQFLDDIYHRSGRKRDMLEYRDNKLFQSHMDFKIYDQDDMDTEA